MLWAGNSIHLKLVWVARYSGFLCAFWSNIGVFSTCRRESGPIPVPTGCGKRFRLTSSAVRFSPWLKLDHEMDYLGERGPSRLGEVRVEHVEVMTHNGSCGTLSCPIVIPHCHAPMSRSTVTLHCHAPLSYPTVMSHFMSHCDAPLSCQTVMSHCGAPLSCHTVMPHCHPPLSCPTVMPHCHAPR